MGFAQDRGRAGEALAASWLVLCGWRLLGRNQRYGGVEVDLVAAEGRVVVLVEVRLRTRSPWGTAVDTVGRRKVERLQRAARALEQQGASRVRVDVITVDVEPEGLLLRHIRNAVTG